jgi:hypothetical protein
MTGPLQRAGTAAGAHMYRLRAAALALAVAATACGGEPDAAVDGGDPRLAFWQRLSALCGQAFAGRVVEAPADDAAFGGATLVMHVRECDDTTIRIPLHVGDNRSRTWVVTRTVDGLRLKHDHRHEDGTPDASNTQYGGDALAPGSAERQEFPADAYSIGVVPARATQAWYLELRPGDVFAYGLHREATGMRYRFEFDLTAPVEAPPPPWGADAR